MAIPLIPFAAGAFLGSAATYLYKDDRLRKVVGEGAELAVAYTREAASYVGTLLQGLWGKASEKVGAEPETAMKEESAPPLEQATPVEKSEGEVTSQAH
jgi:hypothetical protein